VEAQAPVGVVVDEDEERLGGGRDQPRFFFQFPERGLVRLLAVLDLASREFPRSREMRVRGTLRDEDVVPAEHDRERDVEAGGVGDQAGAPAAPGE